MRQMAVLKEPTMRMAVVEEATVLKAGKEPMPQEKRETFNLEIFE
jgi:hypothetical protein